MDFLDRMERRFGRFAIPDLMKYICALYVVGMLITMMAPGVYETYFCLNAQMIMKGQIWRIITFLMQPPTNNLLFFVLMIYFYYMIGSVLERTWGKFRFNVYYFAGVIGTVAAAIILYLVTGSIYILDTTYINASLFLAFGFQFPETEVYLFYVLPIKMKWMAGIVAGLYFVSIINGSWGTRVAIIISLLNFIIFFTSIVRHRTHPAQIRRRVRYQSAVKKQSENVSVHRCAICGRTEKDDDSLEFRFCSKCNGNYEYCQDHLFTHKHVE